MNDQGLKYLSGAIVFVVVTLAFMFRYEYNEYKDRRVSRFTGDIQYAEFCDEDRKVRYISAGRDC